MKKLFFICFLLTIFFYFAGIWVGFCFGDEGDFWRDKEKEKQGWKVIVQDFSHIIYQDKNGKLWTACHSCLKWLNLNKAHKIIIDRRENTRKRLSANKLRVLLFGYKGDEFITISPEGRVLDYEEIYYCDDCYNSNWDK